MPPCAAQCGRPNIGCRPSCEPSPTSKVYELNYPGGLDREILPAPPGHSPRDAPCRVLYIQHATDYRVDRTRHGSPTYRVETKPLPRKSNTSLTRAWVSSCTGAR